LSRNQTSFDPAFLHRRRPTIDEAPSRALQAAIRACEPVVFPASTA
jgi:hypothetical protein